MAPSRAAAWGILNIRLERTLVPKRRHPKAKTAQENGKNCGKNCRLASRHPCQYRAMLGETQKPILPHPRSAQYRRARKKQIPIS